MDKAIETTGKTVDLAIEKALEELGLSARDAEVEVLDEGEPGGLLGFGRRPAKVRVWRSERTDDRADDEDDDTDAAPPTDVDEDEEDTEDFRDDSESPTGERGFAAAENAVLDYIQDILSGIGIHGRIESFADSEGQLHIEVTGSDCGAAIGRHGETLEALQYLSNIVANRYVDEYLRVIVDIAGYRRRREKKLRNMAVSSADRVLRAGRSKKMKPMNPAERRIIHISLRDYPGVTTYSEGTEPNRYVVVAPSAGVEFVGDDQ